MISVITSGMESRVYLDNEGIDDMIHYLTYLREKNETTYDLIEGNELDRLDEDLVLDGFEHITHLELIYINAFDREDRKSTRLNSSHITRSRMPSSA